MILSGTPVRTDQVQLLASMLDGELATKLERAVTNQNSIVALSIDDRHRIVAALGIDGPSGLAELRSVLVTQLKKHADREKQEERVRLHQERTRRHREENPRGTS